ncbi:MAG: DUF305 domain-containing protein [Mycobacterium sp.]
MAALGVAGTMVVLGACSDSGSEPAATTTQAGSSSSSSPATAAAEHNDADVMFAQGMIPHHEQAVEMSDMVLGKQGIDPRVTTLANEIKAAQGPEIAQMRGWLADWGVDPSQGGMAGMPGHDMSGHGAMPGMGGDGMMSEQDMADLQNAQGPAASRLFLTQMIEHHRGAIVMAQNEIDTGQFPAAVEMARSIVTSQQQEITAMEQLLQAL